MWQCCWQVYRVRCCFNYAWRTFAQTTSVQACSTQHQSSGTIVLLVNISKEFLPTAKAPVCSRGGGGGGVGYLWSHVRGRGGYPGVGYLEGMSYSAIHKAAGSLVTSRSLQNGKMSMGNCHTEQSPEVILYGGRQSDSFVNSAVTLLPPPPNGGHCPGRYASY